MLLLNHPKTKKNNVSEAQSSALKGICVPRGLCVILPRVFSIDWINGLYKVPNRSLKSCL